MRTFSRGVGILAAVIVVGDALAQESKPQTQPDQTQPAQTQPGTSPSNQTAPVPNIPNTQPPIVAAADQQPSAHAQASFVLRGEHTFDADLKDSPGSVSVDRAGASFSMRFPIEDRSRLNVVLGTEISSYDFKNATGFVTGFSEPWDQTSQFTASISFSRQATQQWSWYVGAGADASLQNGASFEKAVTAGAFGGVNYSFSKNLTLGLGLQIRSRLDDNGEVLPIPYIDWQIADKWELATHTNVNATELNLEYTPIEPLVLSLNGAYQNREYRLDSTAAAPDGVGRDFRVPIWLGATWNFSKQVGLSASVGADVYQEYKLLDSSGADVATIQTKPTAFIGASLTIRF